MSYCCKARGGTIFVDNDEDMRKVAFILRNIGIDADMDPNDPPLVEIYSSRLMKYDEEDYYSVAKLAKRGSFIRLWGEDDHVWTLLLHDGIVEDCDGEILWDHTEKRSDSDEAELVGQIIDIFEDYLDRKAAPDEDADFIRELEQDVHIKGKDYDELAGNIKSVLSNWGVLKEKGERR